MRRGAYSADLGIGYASIIHSETQITSAKTQAALTIFDVFLDSIVICTTSALIVLVTGFWADESDPAFAMQLAFSQYFPYTKLFFTLLYLLLGYSTVIAYFIVGLKCARFLHPKFGPPVYYIYAALSLFAFSFVESRTAFALMSTSGALLLVVNSIGIFLLRREIDFDLGRLSTKST